VRTFLPLLWDGFASIRSSLPAMAWRVDCRMGIREDFFFENITFKNSAEAKFSRFFAQSLTATPRSLVLAFLRPCINSSCASKARQSRVMFYEQTLRLAIRGG
jgi:hypothetical protein